MSAREIYNLIESGNSKDAQQALFELLSMTQELSTTMLGIAYNIRQLTGHDPINQRSRLWLSEFLELPKGEGK